jgi:peptidoglycan/LPS O-acetylase OafA/YrhL
MNAAAYPQSRPHETATSAGRIPSLDGLRGLSIWAVLLTHASSHFIASPLHGRIMHTVLASLAYFGVTVFFVISGFLITHLLLKEHARTSTVSIANFYRRRAVRILPALLLYFGAVWVLGHPSAVQKLYALTFTTSYFFLPAYPPLQQLWSLSVEEQFYLLWPMLLASGVWTARRCCWAAMLLCPLIRFCLKHNHFLPSSYSHAAPAILDSIAAGCLLAFYYDQVRAFARRWLLSHTAFLSLCVATVLFAEVVYHYDFVALWGAVCGMVVLGICAAIERRDSILNHGPLAWCGILSYSLYLWQQPFLTLDGPLNYLSARLALTFAAAFLSYRFIEQPALRYFTRHASQTQLARASAVAAMP